MSLLLEIWQRRETDTANVARAGCSRDVAGTRMARTPEVVEGGHLRDVLHVLRDGAGLEVASLRPRALLGALRRHQELALLVVRALADGRGKHHGLAVEADQLAGLDVAVDDDLAVLELVLLVVLDQRGDHLSRLVLTHIHLEQVEIVRARSPAALNDLAAAEVELAQVLLDGA